jgi:NADPH-dependent 2,4-dienoyl-CoA reductase/sulfur reductase-like enzyme
VEQGHLVPYAEAVKQAVDVPVIGVGRITEPEYANRIIAERRVDLVAVGRAMIADPDWAAKARAGRLADIVPCIACNLGCSDRRNSALGQMHCLTNPFAGFETERRVEPATSRRRVVVVGGGPGGMETAIIAARRGHDVTLIEREPELGGAYRLAHRAPGKALLKTFLDYLVKQLEGSGAQVRLDDEASADSILRDPPDVVVVATGARFVPPAIPASDAVRVVAALDVLREAVRVEGVVAIIGGDYLGLETADLLAEQGCRVTVFGRNPVVGPTFVAGVRKVLLDRLSRAGVIIHAGAEVVELRPGSVVVAGETEATEFSGFDAVVMATGLRGDGHIAAQLLGKVDEVHIIGDAVQPRTALNAVHEGAEVALQL